MNSTILTTTTQPPGTSDNTVATTEFVNTNLLGYALLNPASPQTFTGDNNFPTQATANNSTLVATTAFIKNQGYAILNANNIFTGTNNRFTSNGANLPISLQNTDVPTYSV